MSSTGFSIQRLEQLCEALYTSSNPNERKEAESQLLVLQSSTQYIPDLMRIFDSSTSNYALMIASTSLSWLVTTNWNKIGTDERLSLRVFVMNYLMARGPGLAEFLKASLVKLVMRITKLGWFDESRHRDIVDETLKLYNASAEHCGLALQLFCGLVEEFNLTSTPGEHSRSMTQQRRCAVSFRDGCLLANVQIAQSTLDRLRQNGGGGVNQDRIAEHALKLLVACLNFDFIGTNADESSDDVGTIQLPASWRPIAQDPVLLNCLFDYFQTSEPPRSSTAMQSLVLLSSLRRSVFLSEGDRARFLNQIMRGIRDILASRNGLNHEENYHEFCRLLGRLKSNYQLSELASTDVYGEWLELAATFTTTSFDQWQWSKNSIHYLLTLWGRLVAAVPYSHRANSSSSNGRPTSLPSSSSSLSPGAGRGTDVVVAVGRSVSSALSSSPPTTDTASPAGIGNSPQDNGQLLEQCVLKVARKYIESMLMSVHIVDASDGSLDDPLDDEGALKEQLERLPVLCRFKYPEIAQFIVEGFDTTIARYREVIERQESSNMISQQQEQHDAKRSAIERQLAWLAYVVASVVSGVSYSSLPSGEGEELLDANLSRRVFDLAQLVDYASARCDERLELALLHFFSNFRRVYLWEQQQSAMHPSARAEIAGGAGSGGISAKQRVLVRVFEQMGMGDSTTATNCIVTKIVNNLRHWPSHEEIIKHTLALFHEMSAGSSSGKLMLNLNAAKFLLEHRTPEHLPFLAQARPRHRTTLNATLARLVFCVIDDGQAAFDAFAAPLLATLRTLSEASVNGVDAAGSEFSTCLIGALRDLRGVTQAALNRRNYNLVFDAIYQPQFFDLFVRAAESSNADIVVSLLRFVYEFVTNKGQRVTFERSSPNGILLFREASRVVVAYGTRQLARRAQIDGAAGNGAAATAAVDNLRSSASNKGFIASEGEYRTRYKGVVIALGILTRALDGNYVNLGVFELYNDRALVDALEIALRLTFTCSFEDVLAYPKLANAYFTFYEVLFREHISFILCKDTDTFALLLSAIHDALEIPAHAPAAATILDHLATYRFTHRRHHNRPAMQALDAHLSQRPTLLKKLLTTLFNQLFFGPPPPPGSSLSNHWVLTRPILSLMLIDERAFLEYKDELIASQDSKPELSKTPYLSIRYPCLHFSVRAGQRLVEAFATLISEVHRNLEASNRDNFTRALSTFRLEVRSFLVS